MQEGLRIESTEEALLKEWEQHYHGCSYATYFQSPDWFKVWQQYDDSLGKEILKINFSDGKSAIIPFFTQKLLKGITKKMIFSNKGTYGSWVSKDDLSEDHFELLIKKINAFDNINWNWNPYLNAGLLVKCEVPFADNITHSLPLDEPMDDLFRKWTKGHKSAVKKAQREGIEIFEAAEPAHWDVYFKVYEDSLKRWGENATSRYKQLIFDLFQSLESGQVKLWLARKDDVIIAGALCLYSPSYVFYWHGAALEAYFNLRPVHLLIYRAIEDAHQKGYQYFDFLPSGRHDGVKAFKKSFATQIMLVPAIDKMLSRKGQLLTTFKKSVKGVILKK